MPTSGNQPPAGGPPGLDRQSIEEASRDAESRPLDFLPTERAAYVRAMVQRVTEFQAAGRTTDEIKERLPEFARDYSHLFEMITQPGGYDRQNLHTMLALLDRMGQGGLNQHQASVIVGQRLLQKYHKK